MPGMRGEMSRFCPASPQPEALVRKARAGQRPWRRPSKVKAGCGGGLEASGRPWSDPHDWRLALSEQLAHNQSVLSDLPELALVCSVAGEHV